MTDPIMRLVHKDDVAEMLKTFDYSILAWLERIPHLKRLGFREVYGYITDEKSPSSQKQG